MALHLCCLTNAFIILLSCLEMSAMPCAGASEWTRHSHPSPKVFGRRYLSNGNGGGRQDTDPLGDGFERTQRRGGPPSKVRATVSHGQFNSDTVSAQHKCLLLFIFDIC